MLKSSTNLTNQISTSLLTTLGSYGKLSNVPNASRTTVTVQQNCTAGYTSAQLLTDQFTTIVKRDAQRIKEMGREFSKLDQTHATGMRRV